MQGIFGCRKILDALPLQDFLCQPLAGGFVVEFQGEPGEGDCAEEYCKGNRAHLFEAVAIIPHPGIEVVHHRIVRNVERIGNIAQEFAEATLSLILGPTRSGYPDDCREDYHRAEDVKDCILPRLRAIANVRCHQQRHNHSAANQESTLNVSRFKFA